MISRKYRNLQLPIVLDASTKLYKIGHKKTDSKRLESVFLAVARKAKSFSFFPLCICLEICIASYQLDRMVIWQSSVFSKRNGFMAFKQ
ncbi:MAG: hypothetical protein C6W58_05890 [Bacillaceae bacterium]|nr:MAG: hypothetical protein C6W58_05890 [Bacillaceae bacterium]